jgi:hypothetical protein
VQRQGYEAKADQRHGEVAGGVPEERFDRRSEPACLPRVAVERGLKYEPAGQSEDHAATDHAEASQQHRRLELLLVHPAAPEIAFERRSPGVY